MTKTILGINPVDGLYGDIMVPSFSLLASPRRQPTDISLVEMMRTLALTWGAYPYAPARWEDLGVGAAVREWAERRHWTVADVVKLWNAGRRLLSSSGELATKRTEAKQDGALLVGTRNAILSKRLRDPAPDQSSKRLRRFKGTTTPVRLSYVQHHACLISGV